MEIGTETRADQGGQQVVVIRLGSPNADWYFPQLTAEYIGWQAKNPADFKWVTGETSPPASGNANNVYINGQGDSYFNAGNVAIGTTNPSDYHQLTVAGSGNARFDVRSETAGHATVRLVSNNANHGTVDSMDASYTIPKNRVVQPNGGNVGIGNSSPSHKLDVTGDIRSSSGFRVGSSQGYTGNVVYSSACLVSTTRRYYYMSFSGGIMTGVSSQDVSDGSCDSGGGGG